MNNFQKKANIILLQIVLITLAFLGLSIFLLFRIYPELMAVGKSMAGKLETICGCQNHFSFINHPFIFSFLILAGISLTLFFSFVIFKLLSFRNSTSRFVNFYLSKRKKNISVKLRAVAELLELGDKVIEVNSRYLVVFCFGWLRPKICISSGTVTMLSSSELKAVLLHEKHHLAVFEPLKVFIVKLAGKILFFVTLIASLTKQYLTFSEMTADRAATGNFKETAPLAKALYKIIKQEERLSWEKSSALSFFSSITGERVSKLVDRSYVPKFRLSSFKLSLVILLVFTLIFASGFSLSFLTNRSIAAGHSLAACPVSETDIIHECQMEEKNSCPLNYNLDSCGF